MGGHRTPARGSRWRAVAAGLLAVAATSALVACGDDDSGSGETAAAAEYPVEVVKAKLKTRQRLGETTLLRLGVRNAGDEAIPALTVTFTVGGKQGRDSALPFGFRDPQPGIAQPDRPVWVLSDNYPRLAGSSERAGAETANLKTFDFGRLPAGESVEAIWELNAVKTGNFKLLYEIGAGPEGKTMAAGGAEAGGSFAVRVTEVPPNTVVTDSGEVVPAPRDPTQANR